MIIFLFSAPGCGPVKESTKDVLKDNKQVSIPEPPLEQAPKKAKGKPADYFPLNLCMSWNYLMTSCPPSGACVTRNFDAIIKEKKQIQGKTVYVLKNGITGYIEDGGYVYIVTISKGKIVNKGIAGKHDLKPGDSWQKRFSEKYKNLTVTCGEREIVGVPEEDQSPTFYEAICCKAKASDGFKYAACYTSELGMIGEYYPEERSEMVSYSVHPEIYAAKKDCGLKTP